MLRPLLMAALFTLLCRPPEVSAETIAIVLDCKLSMEEGNVRAYIKATNEGDENAYALRVQGSLADTTGTSALIDTLAPGDEQYLGIDLGPSPTQPGSYTTLFVARYEDQNGYPYSTISWPILKFETDIPPEDAPIGLEVAGMRLDSRGQVTAELASHHPAPLTLLVALHTPDEFEADRSVQQLTLQPGEVRAIRFPIDRGRALDGSSYLVAVDVHYELEGRRRAAVVSALIDVGPESPRARRSPTAFALLGLLLVVAFFVIQFLAPASWRRLQPPRLERVTRLAEHLLLTAATVFTLWHRSPEHLWANTTVVGGDMPAHNYLASHLRETLFGEGRIISWAPGWWAGFPMFQYYFALPYALVALLEPLLSHNLALKLVSISGLLALPWAAYVGAGWMRLPRPIPVLTGIAMLAVIFVPPSVHVMWGVNIYSTLAGMMANSLSFALMLLYLGSAHADARKGRGSARSAVLFALCIASHFFTSLVAAISVAVLPLLAARQRRTRAFLALCHGGLLGAGLMAWWLLPLIAKRGFAVDFGENWDVALWAGRPPFTIALLVPAGFAVLIALTRRATAAGLLLWMFAASLALFLFGYEHVSAVFVNVRLWPFLYYALAALAAIGVGYMLRRRRARPIAAAALLCLVIAGIQHTPHWAREWAAWNYSGLESKPRWPQLQALLETLDGTPGRLANDLHESNNALGSTRVFEVVPHLIDKPILEGGIVNSALGSLFAYYIQCETSDNCAGLPTRVRQTDFDLQHAIRHLELFNVKHFIARSERTRDAMDDSEAFRLMKRSGPWSLYELTTHAGNLVSIPLNMPIAVASDDWKDLALEWFYTFEALDVPLLFVDEEAPAGVPQMSEAEVRTALGHLGDGATPTEAFGTNFQTVATRGHIVDETIASDRIRFRTTAVHAPHLIKCSYFPNWKVRGADAVYRVSPAFLLVYPQQEEVELYYGQTSADRLGKGLSLAALGALLAMAVYRRKAGSVK